ncbi:MAG: hypothetical protein DRO67_00975 [Candidatus Asgardarchaeum californiense]|nr:MAG: hypothetical protein DRO67_00975 [Candidatus Asgardarchaeum californiense]
MKTLNDTVYNFFEKYIKRTPTKEDALKAGSKYSDEQTKESDDIQLTPYKRGELARMSPVFMKGVSKKALDSIRAWFDLETTSGTAPIKMDLDAFKAFEKRSNYKSKLNQAIKDAHIYGDGFLLIQFDQLDKGNKFVTQPPKNSEPRSVIILSPEYITDIKYISESNKKSDLYHYVYDDGSSSYLIHPDRIQHIKIDEVSSSKFGLSKIDLLRNTIKSKKNVDIAVGRILSWFSHGMLDIKQYDLNADDAKKIKQVAASHPSVWMHDPEDFEIDVIQPQAIDPKEFMSFLILNIASALIMPMHILTGIQVGKVTGAEIGTADYYRDIRDMQELIYTPLIEDLYKRIIEARGRDWKYSLAWKTVYVDELGEAIIMEKRAAFVTSLFSSGLVDLEEARSMLNEGLYQLDTKKEIEKKDGQTEKTNEPKSTKSSESK